MNTLYVTIGPLDLLDKEASVNLKDEDAGKKQEGYVVVVKKKTLYHLYLKDVTKKLHYF